MPQVIDLRLRILTNLCKWDLGDKLAGVLQYAGEDDEDAQRYRITCAEYHHARARALLADGDTAGARDRVKLASELWPPIRLEMIDDPALEDLWLIGKRPKEAIDCQCDFSTWPNGVGAVCDAYEPFSEASRDCRHCDHAEACHETG